MSNPFDEIKEGFRVLKREYLAARKEQDRKGATDAQKKAADKNVAAVLKRWRSLREFEKKLSQDMEL